jgi:acetyltransferase-like isoleucine patch superfamily enzyme
VPGVVAVGSGPVGGARSSPTDNPYNPLAWFIGDPVIGEGTWIGPFCLVDGSGGLVIGRGCDLAAGVHVYTHSSMRRCISDRTAPLERRPVRIGDCTFIGANAVILMGVTIGSHCVIGAGAVVSINIPDRSVAVGVPARVVGTVDPATGAITYAE